MTAVQLDQHALPWHSLTAYPVIGRSSAARIAQSGVDRDAPQGDPADVDAFPFVEQFAQMGVVGHCVHGTSQTHYTETPRPRGVALVGLRPRRP